MSDTLGELMDIFMSQSQNTPRSTHRHGSRNGECKVVQRFKPTYDSTKVVLRDNLGKSRYRSVSEMPIHMRPQTTGVPTASRVLDYNKLMLVAVTLKITNDMSKAEQVQLLRQALNDRYRLNMDTATVRQMVEILVTAHIAVQKRA